MLLLVCFVRCLLTYDIRIVLHLFDTHESVKAIMLLLICNVGKPFYGSVAFDLFKSTTVTLVITS